METKIVFLWIPRKISFLKNGLRFDGGYAWLRKVEKVKAFGGGFNYFNIKDRTSIK